MSDNLIFDPTVEATDYMKGTNDPPLKPCEKCGAEINANWTIRKLQALLKSEDTAHTMHINKLTAQLEAGKLLSEHWRDESESPNEWSDELDIAIGEGDG